MPALEGGWRSKRRKKIKNLDSKHILTRLQCYYHKQKLETIHTIKNEIKQILYFLYQHNKIRPKSLQQFNQIIVIFVEIMIVIRGPKTCLNFEWSKDVDENFCSLKLNL